LSIYIHSLKIDKWCVKKKRVQTVLIDLANDGAHIFNEINKTTRYHIRRSNEKDCVELLLIEDVDDSEINNFCLLYNSFASAVGIGNANKAKIISLRNNGHLFFAKAIDKNGKLLCMHALISDDSRVRLLYSYSIFRMLDKDVRDISGRANKSLHWFEINQFKNRGLKYYDFGGISLNGETKNIDKFKMAFGGKVVTEYNAICLDIFWWIR